MEKINMAAVIKHNRIVMGLTQEELASNLYVTKATVSKWERGQGYPETSLIPKIANFFGISIDELFDYAPENGYACKVSYTGVILKEEIEDFSRIGKMPTCIMMATWKICLVYKWENLARVYLTISAVLLSLKKIILCNKSLYAYPPNQKTKMGIVC